MEARLEVGRTEYLTNPATYKPLNWGFGSTANRRIIMQVKPSTVTMELSIDLASPEMQDILRREADYIACAVVSVDHGSEVIRHLEQSRADCVGPTHALDHMIAAIERRIGRLEFDVRIAACQLWHWGKTNKNRAKSQNEKAYLRRNYMHKHRSMPF